MRKHLKSYFFPHKENDYKPHFLRKDTLSFLVVLFVFIEGALLLSSFGVFKDSDFLAAVFPSTLINLTNENRTARHLGELKVNTLLAKAAELKAADMATKGYFAHTSPEGLTPWHWLDAAGYGYLYAGENLAVNFYDSKDVSDAWMNSPAHKENIVNGHYTEIGIAVVEGMYKGQQATFVVQYFGSPAPVSPDEWRKVLAENSKDTLPAPVPAPTKKVVKKPTASVSVKTPNVGEKIILKTPSTIPAPQSAPLSATSPLPENQIKGESTMAETQGPTAIPQNKSFVKLLESPKTAVFTVLLAILLFLSIVLAIAVLVEIKIQHPKMIIGTLLVIFIAIGIMYLNSKIFTSITELPTDTNYASVFKAF